MRVIRLTLLTVSTHSRPKAAGIEFSSSFSPIGGFNTQPPEGGWRGVLLCRCTHPCFNTQPPEGGWAFAGQVAAELQVSTHSRPKAAG